MTPDPRERLRAVGLADLFGGIALLSGAAALLTSILCCLAPFEEDEAVLAYVVVLSVAVWTATFGLVTRGTDEGTRNARVGAALALGAALLSLLTLCMTEVW